MRAAGPPFRVAAQPIAASPSSSAPTDFWAYTPPVAVAAFDEATSPTNNTIPMRAAGPPSGVAAQPIAASQSSSAPTDFWAYTPPVAVAEFNEATSPENNTIPVVAAEARRLRCGPQDRRLQVFGVHTPPVAVAEFDEATSPANNTIPVVAAEARRRRCGPQDRR